MSKTTRTPTPTLTGLVLVVNAHAVLQLGGLESASLARLGGTALPMSTMADYRIALQGRQQLCAKPWTPSALYENILSGEEAAAVITN